MTYHHELLFQETITPLHVGCGQDVGVVDLPVIRERTTGYPIVPGSGIRGSMRDRVEGGGSNGCGGAGLAARLFGPRVDDQEAERHAGCLSVQDARLLLFPVRSDRRVFLWITCPFVLGRFKREVGIFTPSLAALTADDWPEPGEGELLASADLGGPTYLEEFSHSPAAGAKDAAERLRQWAGGVELVLELPGIKDRTVLVSDRSFFHFANHATLVTQHNRLDSAKTVEEGGLFSVEAVPPEAIFYSFVGATRLRQPERTAPEPTPSENFAALWKALTPNGENSRSAILTLGGHESTGLGLTRLVRASNEGGAR